MAGTDYRAFTFGDCNFNSRDTTQMKNVLPYLFVAALALWSAGFADNDAKIIADLQARVKVLEKVNKVNTDTLDKLNIVDTHLTTAINAHTEAIKAILRK